MIQLASLYVMAAVASSAAFLALGLLVWLYRRREVHSRFWIAFCWLMSATSLSISISTHAVETGAASLLTARLGLSFATVTLLCLLGFALSFVGPFRAARPLLFAALGVAAVLVALFWSSALIIQGVRRSALGLFQPVPGPLLPVYLLFVAFCTLTPPYLFIKAYRTRHGHVRVQLGYMLAAMAIIGLAALGSLLPMLDPESELALVPTVLMVLAPSLITYAIIRHRLWGIRTVVHKTALWLAASSLVLLPIWAFLRFGVDATGPAALGGALLLFGIAALHYRKVQPWLDRRFARRPHDPLKVLDTFNHEVLNLRGLRDLAELLESTLRSALHAGTVEVWAKLGPDRLTGLGSVAGEECQISDEMESWLASVTAAVDASGPAEAIEPGVRAALLDRKLLLALPLVHEGRLLALVCLGEKHNLRAYVREDLELLERIRAPATVAIANAALYDRLHELTSSLESRVEQRTHELHLANEQLRELDRVKTKFFANITHELRTPLTLLLAPLEDLLLARTEADPWREDLEAMHRNGLRLLRQINALLDLARLDAGTMRLRLGDLHVNHLVEAAVRSFRAIAARKELALGFSALDGNDSISGDAEKLELVISNLLANAVKFTPAGGTVTVAVVDEPPWVLVRVRDTGIGIPAEHLDRIFDRFAQVDGGTTRRFEGAGIGLALVKELVTLHQGSVAVSSEEGKGSEFRVRLPRALHSIPDELVDRREVDLPTEHARRVEDQDPVAWVPFQMGGEAYLSVDRPSAEPRVTGRAGARILVVEDNSDMRSYLERRLAERFQVSSCVNGREALRIIADRAPDLVLADVMMPELSGYELCRTIKADPSTARVPVILVTARKGVDRTLEGFQAGADDYLTKPFNLQELVARVDVQLKLAELGRKLAEQEKAALLNLVAAGLAHEVRNPVNAILNAARPLRDGLALGGLTGDARAIVNELLEVILESARRIDVLIGDFLNVSRSHPGELAPWAIEQALESTVRLLRYKHGRKIQVEQSLRHATPVVGRTAQLNQVLMNLVDNAINAAGTAGTVWICTEELDGKFVLRVRDDGPGVPPGLERRIFDPLFTTRPTQSSTGLGLYITERIVQAHGGRILVSRSPSGGADFAVEIPLDRGS